ncbi:MAG: hypothetical protein RIS35_3274, partial [Pseudomonadota bacterium]
MLPSGVPTVPNPEAMTEPSAHDAADAAENPLRACPRVRGLPGSLIREVANAGMNAGDVLAFWFGEPDEVTPAFIREAAHRA